MSSQIMLHSKPLELGFVLTHTWVPFYTAEDESSYTSPTALYLGFWVWVNNIVFNTCSLLLPSGWKDPSYYEAWLSWSQMGSAYA